MKPSHRKYAVGLVLALILALGFSVQPPYEVHFWERLPIFEALFGFLGCLLILFVSKTLGHLFIQKREGHYDE